MPTETWGNVGTTVTVSGSMTINAIAYKTGLADSPVTTGVYDIQSGGTLVSAQYTTSYTYDVLNNLTGVSMTRPTVRRRAPLPSECQTCWLICRYLSGNRLSWSVTVREFSHQD
jgi:hypothetical protein